MISSFTYFVLSYKLAPIEKMNGTALIGAHFVPILMRTACCTRPPLRLNMWSIKNANISETFSSVYLEDGVELSSK